MNVEFLVSKSDRSNWGGVAESCHIAQIPKRTRRLVMEWWHTLKPVSLIRSRCSFFWVKSGIGTEAGQAYASSYQFSCDCDDVQTNIAHDQDRYGHREMPKISMATRKGAKGTSISEL